MGILYKKHQNGGNIDPDYTLGALLIDKYKANPKLANKWYSSTAEGKTTSLVTNIESVLNTGGDKRDIADLGKLYREKTDIVNSFMKF